MNMLRIAFAGTAFLLICGCGDGRDALDPTAPSLAVQDRSAALPSSAARRIQASGHFDAIVNFATLTLTPRGVNCLLEVDGQLVFTGTIEGTAVGRTSALVFAPCSDVATTPPGTFRDVFKSELVFRGTVDGEPAQANLLYMGGVQPGGEIAGRLLFSNGVAGRLEVEARVAVGGDYHGAVVVR